MKRFRWALLIPIALGAWWLMDLDPAPKPRGATHRVIVLGFDGLDPALLKEGIDAGRLPHFASLAKDGSFQPLATTEPPQSPVAWSSFATGLNPGGHGIFDFLHRDPTNYGIDFSIAEQLPPETLNVLGVTIPTSDGALINRRQGEPFWLQAETDGLRVAAMRVPVTYPPDPITHMLSGMGVPDLLGTQGTYTLIANHRVADAESGGRVLMVRTDPDGAVRTLLDGPTSPSSGKPMSVPIVVFPDGDGVRLELDGDTIRLAPNAWSDWLRVRFRFLGAGRVDGMVRARLVSGFPRMRLYLTPIQVDPRSPALAITAPAHDAAHLAEAIGVFHTLGMPEETWSMNQGHLDESAWLDSVRTTLAEGEAMLKWRLAQNDSDIVIKVFVQTDRVSHMFWRARDPLHPLFASSSDEAKGAIDWIYGEADRIVGETRAAMAPGDRLIILSDHGFTDYRRSAHVNRWLHDAGYLVLESGARESGPMFADVDWSKTRAYAMGLNGIYVNLIGREAHGIVAPIDQQPLVDEIASRITAWTDETNGNAVVLRATPSGTAYRGAHSGDAPDLVVGFDRGYRASWQTSLGGVPGTLIDDNLQPWSGDHCVAAELVPGVLLTSFPLQTPVDGIGAVGALIVAQARDGNP